MRWHHSGRIEPDRRRDTENTERRRGLFLTALLVLAAVWMTAGSPAPGYTPVAAETTGSAATAAAVNLKENHWIFSSYTDSDGHSYAAVNGYDDDALTLEVPDSLGGLPVRIIGREAFAGSRYLTGIVLPEGVTEIGRYAFQGCVGLRDVTLPSTLKQVGEGAFFGCRSLETVDLSQNVVRIGGYAFSGCLHLREAKLSPALRSIGDGAFDGCAGLEAFEPTEGLESVGIEAFRGCGALTTVRLPDSLRSLGAGAFENDALLEEAVCGSGLEELPAAAFRRCASLRKISFGSVKRIGSSALEGCASLEEAALTRVTDVGSLAFFRCTALRRVTLGKSVGTVGRQAFGGCSSLNRLTVDKDNATFTAKDNGLYTKNGETLLLCPQGASSPLRIAEGTRKIADFACFGCASLPAVRLPETVTSIGTAAFMNCTDLSVVTVPDEVEKLGVLPFGCFFEGGGLVVEPYFSAFGEQNSSVSLFCASRNIPFSLRSQSLEVSCRRVTLAVGETFDLRPAFTAGGSVPLVWTSEDTSVVRVKDGRLTAAGEGETTVILSAEGFESVTVQVKVNAARENRFRMRSTFDNRLLYAGDTEELSTLLDQLIDPLIASDKFWYSTNPSVAVVSDNGTVRALKSGKASITCRMEDGSEKNCLLTVVTRPMSFGVTCPADEILTGKSVRMEKKLRPSSSEDPVTWESESPDVIAVDDKGTLTGLKQGSSKITCVTASGLRASVTVRCAAAAEALSLSPETREVYQGKEFTLEASLTPSDSRQTVRWRSSDPTVATVNSKGKVKGVSFGQAVIYAETDTGLSARCAVTVLTKAEKLRLDVKKLTLNSGDSHTVQALVFPSYSPETTDKCQWSTTDEKVATVDDKGTVTAVGAGSCILNCRCADELISKCRITVRQPVRTLKITGDRTECYVGEALSLGVEKQPENATDSIRWQSADESIATITSNGSVKGIAPGRVTVTAQALNEVSGSVTEASVELLVMRKAESVTLRKKELSLRVGETDSLVYSILPSDSNDTVRWSSSDESVAVVRSDGLITAAGAGSCEIRVETGSGCVARCQVTVA